MFSAFLCSLGLVNTKLLNNHIFLGINMKGSEIICVGLIQKIILLTNFGDDV